MISGPATSLLLSVLLMLLIIVLLARRRHHTSRGQPYRPSERETADVLRAHERVGCCEQARRRVPGRPPEPEPSPLELAGRAWLAEYGAEEDDGDPAWCLADERPVGEVLEEELRREELPLDLPHRPDVRRDER